MDVIFPPCLAIRLSLSALCSARWQSRRYVATERQTNLIRYQITENITHDLILAPSRFHSEQYKFLPLVLHT